MTPLSFYAYVASVYVYAYVAYVLSWISVPASASLPGFLTLGRIVVITQTWSSTLLTPLRLRKPLLLLLRPLAAVVRPPLLVTLLETLLEFRLLSWQLAPSLRPRRSLQQRKRTFLEMMSRPLFMILPLGAATKSALERKFMVMWIEKGKMLVLILAEEVNGLMKVLPLRWTMTRSLSLAASTEFLHPLRTS